MYYKCFRNILLLYETFDLSVKRLNFIYIFIYDIYIYKLAMEFFKLNWFILKYNVVIVLPNTTCNILFSNNLKGITVLFDIIYYLFFFIFEIKIKKYQIFTT